VQGNIPGTAQLDLGEIGINTYDGKVFIKKDDGTASIVEVGADIPTVVNFTATAGQTDFPTPYNTANVEVFSGGIKLRSTEYTATNGTSVILEAQDLNTWVQIRSNTDSPGATVPWGSVTGTPTTISGYGITDALVATGATTVATLGTITTGTWQGTQITDAYIASAGTWNAKADSATTLAGYGITDAVEDFADLGVTPTTLAGYGVVDSIKSLDDVYSSMSPTDGQALIYDTTNGWQSESISTYTPEVISVKGDPADTTSIPLNTFNDITTWVTDITNTNYTFDAVTGTITINASLDGKLVRVDWLLGGTNAGTNRVTLETFLQLNGTNVQESSNYIVRDGTNDRGGIQGHWLGVISTSDVLKIQARTITTALTRDGIACRFTITTMN